MRILTLFFSKKLLQSVAHSMIIEESSFGTFVQKVNPLTGRPCWELQDENYDYHQEIARSMYADMLHDYNRNKKYYAALKKAIEAKHASGQEAHVLDIGTGTGLLSMMAANCGADSIVACEGFPPIAEIAKKVIADNDLSHKIKVISKRSTELKVGQNQDLERRANILVTEVFDTELIGEGAVETFNHANEHLLERGSIIVPWSSNVYAVLLDSELLASFNRIKPSFPLPDTEGVHLPPEMVDCAGNAGVHDLQASQVPRESMTMLSPPLRVFKFNFFEQMISSETTVARFRVTGNGECNVACVYWTLDMDPDQENIVSCAPSFIEPTPWRDHWMQAIYHLKNPTKVAEGEELVLVAKHDQYSMWYDVHKAEEKYDLDSLQMPACTCGLHGIASRTRLYAMNDSTRWQKYVEALRGKVRGRKVLCIGDTSVLPMAVAKMGAETVKVLCVDDSSLCKSVVTKMIKHNNLEEKILLLEPRDINRIPLQIDMVVAEPFFRDSVFPWDNLRFWYLAAKWAPHCTRLLPGKMKLFGVAMEFEHLHKIREPLGQVEGFNMTSFDRLIEELGVMRAGHTAESVASLVFENYNLYVRNIEGSSKKSDADVDVHPMYEYPGQLLSAPQCLQEFSLDSPPPEKRHSTTGVFKITREGQFHGVVIWAEWSIGDATISTGLDEKNRWDMGTRQGVYFLREPYKVVAENAVHYDVTLSPQVGSFAFTFGKERPPSFD